jgi:hypothetical protein
MKLKRLVLLDNTGHNRRVTDLRVERADGATFQIEMPVKKQRELFAIIEAEVDGFVAPAFVSP